MREADPDRLSAKRQAITEAALSLYLANGFDGTTVDMIAERAEISRRSIFRYFGTKEDIVLAWTEATGPELTAHLENRLDIMPYRYDPASAAISAVLGHLEANRNMQSLSLEVSNLIERTPSLRARSHEKYLAWETMLTDAMTDRGIARPTAGMAAAIAIGGLRVAVREWSVSGGKRDLVEYAKAAYAVMDGSKYERIAI